MYQNREEFLAKFQQQQKYNTIMTKEKENQNDPNTRWNDLYKLEKRKRSKIEEQKMEKDRINTEKELRECTFTPKLNTNYTSNRTKVNNDNENNESPYASHLTLFARENAWKQKKLNKIEKVIQSNINKEMEECMFTPTINEAKILKQNDFYIQAQSLVVDPESYEQYINRKTKIREREEKNHQRERSMPGAGNIYDKQLKQRNRSTHNLIVLNKSNDQFKLKVRLYYIDVFIN